MVFNTSSIKRKFKYKSTVSKPSSSTPTPTSYKSTGPQYKPQPKPSYEGPQRPVKRSKSKRNYDNRQTDLPTTLEQAVNSDKLVITPKSKNFFDRLSSLNIVGGVAYGETTESNSSIDGIPTTLEQAVNSDKLVTNKEEQSINYHHKLDGPLGKIITGKTDVGDGRWLDQALIDLPSNINNWWENATMPTKEKYALNAAEGELNEKSDKKYSAEQFPLYYGASSKQNIVTDGGVDQGMVKHTGYADLDTTNATLNKQNTVNNATYIPGVTKAMGVSSNVSMGWNLESKPTGSTKSNSISSNLQFQANTKVHSGMVDTWQKGFLTSSSRDKTSASHWLNAQLGKIDSMQGTDRNKNMFKKDLQERYDGLFGNTNSPFQSQQNLKHNNISNGLTRQQERKEAKRLQAVQARDGYFNSSSINNWMPSNVVTPQGPPNKKVTPAGDVQKTNLLSDFATGNF